MKTHLSDFLPYLLNQAAELASSDFQPHYKDQYGMLRTEWRVLFHLGQYGEMTAKQICDQAALHKTKVSRAVVALEKKRFLRRETVESDRRSEALTLTRAGRTAFEDLARTAAWYDRSIEENLGSEAFVALKATLTKLISDRSAEPPARPPR